MDTERIKNELGSIADSINSRYDGIKKAQETQQEQLDSLSHGLKTGAVGGGNFNRSFENQLTKALVESEQFQAVRNKSAREANINLNLKASDIFTSTNLTGDVIGATRVPGVVYNPERTQHIRELLPMGSTDSNSIEFYRESAIEDNTAMVGEGQLKPASDFSMTAVRTEIKKLATSLTVSEEILDDMAALSSYISSRFTQKLLNLEDTQLLYGSGVGVNLQGLTTVASPFTGAAMPANSNLFDLLRTIVTRAQVSYYRPTAIVLHPNDVLTLSLLKDSEGRYLFQNLMNGAGLSIAGTPIVESTVMLPGNFLVGDFARGAQLFQRMGISVRVYDQHLDFAQRNKVLFVIEERIGLAIYRPEAFIYDSIADSLAGV